MCLGQEKCWWPAFQMSNVVPQSWPICLLEVVTIALLVQEVYKIMMGQTLSILTPHQDKALLEIKGHL